MRFKVFPCDLEGVGCYRIIYPYGLIDQHTDHEVVMELSGANVVDELGNTRLGIPEAVLGGEHGEYADEFLDADVFVLQRPLEKVYAPLAAWLKQHGKTIVVDLDDYMHGIPEGNRGLREIRKSKMHDVRVLARVFRYADVLTVSTPKLAELYEGRVSEVRVLPNYLLKRDWTAPPSFTVGRSRLHVGWMGSLQWRGNDLKIVQPVLRRFLRRHPEAVFVNVGGPDTLKYLALPKDQTLHFQGKRFPGHAPLTANIDIGLAPLARNVFNECKSSLKGQEYGAAGAAVIATPTGPYLDWVEPGVNGFLANTAAEWEQALEDAAQGWRELAAANHAKSMAHLIDDRYQEWLQPAAVAA